MPLSDVQMGKIVNTRIIFLAFEYKFINVNIKIGNALITILHLKVEILNFFFFRLM